MLHRWQSYSSNQGRQATHQNNGNYKAWLEFMNWLANVSLRSGLEAGAWSFLFQSATTRQRVPGAADDEKALLSRAYAETQVKALLP